MSSRSGVGGLHAESVTTTSKVYARADRGAVIARDPPLPSSTRLAQFAELAELAELPELELDEDALDLRDAPPTLDVSPTDPILYYTMG